MKSITYCLLLAVITSGSALGSLSTLEIGVNTQCKPSVTTASGRYVTHKGSFCSGDLIFEDTFDRFDMNTWQHENTLSGGGNWEFQWYSNNRSNSFCEDGFLHLRPTLTSDVVGEHFLSSGRLNIDGGAPAELCTNPTDWGCERVGTRSNIVNPIRSSRLRTVESFSFKYGKVEVSAKLPAGDWLWPAIWLMPTYNGYGTWPASGEIDLVESRGNRDFVQNGIHIGNEQIGSTLHFGPYTGLNGFPTAHFSRNSPPGNGWSNDFHRYKLEWTPEKITFAVDDIEIGTVKAGNGFWARGGFNVTAPGIDNPWRLATPMAPFDQEFHLIMNLAVGGIAFFPDDARNANGKPWNNHSPTAATDFWNARNDWLPTWNLDHNLSREASLIVDYVRIWAL